MPNNQINAKIVSRNDSKTNWTTNNPKPLKGELCIEFDPSHDSNSYTVKAKVGDGVNYYNDLPYLAGEAITVPVPDGTSIVDDNGTWKLAGFDAATADKFPVKRITNNVASIEWVSLPSHFGDIDNMYTAFNSLGTAATKNVAASGDASATEVVMGNDSRLNSVRYDTASQGLTDTQKSNARTNIGAGTSSFSGDYDDLSNKPTIPSTAADVGAIPSTDKGAASGVAELDANGKVPASQLPSYVDDTVEGYYNTTDGKFYEESTYTTEITGETGKIYVSLDTNKTYRWSGSAFVVISDTIALGETSSTAYRGDRGKIAYDHSQSTHAPSNAEHNVIVGVQVNSVDLTPDANRKVNVPIGTASTAGVVKSSSSDDQVSIDNASGTMTVNKVTTDKLKNGSDTLVFICGDSSS